MYQRIDGKLAQLRRIHALHVFLMGYGKNYQKAIVFAVFGTNPVHAGKGEFEKVLAVVREVFDGLTFYTASLPNLRFEELAAITQVLVEFKAHELPGEHAPLGEWKLVVGSEDVELAEKLEAAELFGIY